MFVTDRIRQIHHNPRDRDMTEEPGTGAGEDFRDYYDLFDSEAVSPYNDSSTQVFGGLLLPVLYSTVFVVGLLGNALVLWVLIRSWHRWSLTDVCLLSLAVSDLLSLASLPVRAHSDVDQWVFGTFACHTVTALFVTALYSSVFFIVLMTLERYVIVVYEHSICSRKWPALALFVWMLSLFVSLPNIVFAQVRQTTSIKTSCRSEFPRGTAWMSFTYVNILSLILPLIITSFCFCQILSKSGGKQSVVRLLLAVLAVYFLFWTPYNIVTFLEFLQTKGYLISPEWYSDLSLARQCVEAVALIHCCLNPIIYACAGQKFRRVLKEQPPPESTSSEYSSTLIA